MGNLGTDEGAIHIVEALVLMQMKAQSREAFVIARLNIPVSA